MAQSVRWPAGNLNWRLYEKVLSFSVTTDYIKTTGFSGFLFGHFSQAHENQVLTQIQQFLAQELNGQRDIDLNLIQLLPPTIEKSEIHTIDLQSDTRQSLFGTEKVDRYEKYQVDYTMRINVLYPGQISVDNYEDKGPVDPSIRIEYRNGNRWIPLGELGSLDPELLSLGAVDLSKPTTEVAKLSISDVHRKYRYELGSYLTTSLPHAKDILLANNTEIRVIMDFKDQSGQVTSSQVLESTNRFEKKNQVLKNFGIKGVGRYFDTFFYAHHLKQFRNKVFGAANKCRNLFQ